MWLWYSVADSGFDLMGVRGLSQGGGVGVENNWTCWKFKKKNKKNSVLGITKS